MILLTMGCEVGKRANAYMERRKCRAHAHMLSAHPHAHCKHERDEQYMYSVIQMNRMHISCAHSATALLLPPLPLLFYEIYGILPLLLYFSCLLLHCHHHKGRQKRRKIYARHAGVARVMRAPQRGPPRQRQWSTFWPGPARRSAPGPIEEERPRMSAPLRDDYS